MSVRTELRKLADEATRAGALVGSAAEAAFNLVWPFPAEAGGAKSKTRR